MRTRVLIILGVIVLSLWSGSTVCVAGGDIDDVYYWPYSTERPARSHKQKTQKAPQTDTIVGSPVEYRYVMVQDTVVKLVVKRR